jgi:hypothetical protein
MGCCDASNKKCNRQKEEIISPDALTALASDGSWVLQKLLEIARGGVRFVGFKNVAVNELAATIAGIVAENNYLKRMLGIFHPGRAAAEKSGAIIMFGPKNEYKLFIPAISETARAKLSASLISAGEELLDTQPIASSVKQQYLPFSS